MKQTMHDEVRRPRGRVNSHGNAVLIDPTDRQAVEAAHRQHKQAECDAGRLRGDWERGGLGLSVIEMKAIQQLASEHGFGIGPTVRALITEALQARGYQQGLSPTLDDLRDRSIRRDRRGRAA